MRVCVCVLFAFSKVRPFSFIKPINVRLWTAMVLMYLLAAHLQQCQRSLPAQAESLLHSLDRAEGGVGLYVNTDKTEFLCFNQRGDIYTLNGGSQKLVDKFTYQGSISSSENYINAWLAKAWRAIDRLSVIYKSDLSDKIKRIFFQAAVVSILLYGFTTRTLTKRHKKKLDGNCRKTLRDISNKSWKQHSTKSSCTATYLLSGQPS